MEAACLVRFKYRMLEVMSTAHELKSYNERFADIAHRFQDKIAIQLKSPAGYTKTTYGEMYRQVQGEARALVAQGLKRQERAAILSENRPEWVISYLSIYLAGGIVVPLDPQISQQEWRRLLDDSDARVIFVSGLLFPALKQAVADSPLRERIICFDPEPAGDGASWTLSRLVEWGQNLNPTPSLPESRLSDTTVIIYTSGTTGKPKGVMLTQENIVSEITAALKAFPIVGENDALLCMLPLQHVFASVISFLLPLYLGARVVFADTLKRSEILTALQEAGITVLATVPQFFYLFDGRIEEELSRKGAAAQKLFRSLLRLNRFTIRHLRLNVGKLFFRSIHHTFGSRMRLFVSGGSAFDPKVAQVFYDLGFTILQGYGLTETTGACSVTRVENNVIGSVGPPLPGVNIKIINPGDGGIGEVAIRGPIVMKGYYKNPEATAEVLRDGWLCSGDLGRLDERGNLYITGRKKEVIVLPNGKNIYPDEIEAHYEQCPFIKEIAVLGIADREHQGGERLHAVVVPDFEVLRARKIANAREILRDEIARLSHQLPKYKRLMSYQIQKEELPRTTTRKIKRVELKSLIESGTLQETEAADATQEVAAGDRELLESAVGQQVISCLRGVYRRDAPIKLEMNLELDLGFDSMERVELLASLGQALGVELPESFGAEVYTVRDLIISLQQQASGSTGAGALRQSWGSILSTESLAKEKDLETYFAGMALTFFKYTALKMIHVLFRALFRYETTGVENLPREGPFLICPNHLSYLDGLAVLAGLPYSLVRRVFFVGASEFFTSLPMRVVAWVANIIPVDPDANLLRAMKVGAYGLRTGRILCIFPEGARSFDGHLGEFKKGATILASEIGAPMIPTAIRGTYEVWQRDSRRIHLHKVKVVFGTPLQTGAVGERGDYQAETDRLHKAVESLITTCCTQRHE
jgi:long-chain acyl-CoA synthetase